jgi:hypothetical protein
MALSIDIWDSRRNMVSQTLSSTFDTLAEAYAHCSKWKSKLQVYTPDETFLISGTTVGGEEYDAHEPDLSKGAEQVRKEILIDQAASYDEMRREMAMEMGMLHGIEAYNDMMGYY